MRKILSYAVLASLLTVVSCRNDEGEMQNGQEEGLILNSDAKALNKRILFDNAGVLDMKPSSGGKTNVAGNFPLVLVAEVAPPSYNGKTLRATQCFGR